MSTDDRKDLPPVNSANFLEKLREFASTYLGNRGDKMDRGITLRDLIDAGIVTLRPGFLSNGGRIAPIGGVGTAISGAYEPDLTPPPTPTGFTATAAISHLMVQCDPQIYLAGHGHAKSILYGASYTVGQVYASGSTYPVFTDAVVLEEFSGTVFSHATNPATTWHLWLTWVTVDGVASTTPAGGTNGVMTRTGEDVALLLEALSGEIGRSQLNADLAAPINLIDGGVSQAALPYPLAKLAALQDGMNQQARLDLNAAAESVLQTAVAINATQQTVHDAGININPATGLVEIFGLELAKTHLTTVDVRLDAAEGNINLKASTTYVDGAIATATLQPADLLLFNGMDARVSTAETNISSLNSSVTSKASNTDLTATTARVTTTESNIDALNGQMTLKVNSADYTAVTNGLDARLGSAEVSLSSVGDISGIVSMVQQGNMQTRNSEADATTLLRTLLSGEAGSAKTRDELAVAREDMTATVIAGVSAEAEQRLELAAVVSGNQATLVNNYYTKVTTDAAISSATSTLAATVAGNQAVVLDSYYTKASTDSAIATSISQVQARLDTGDYAVVKVESSASASAVTGLNAQYTIKQDVAGLVSGYGMATTANNAAPSSAFGVRSNQFYVAPPATVSSTEPTTNLYDGFCWLDTSVTPAVTRYRSGATWSLVSPVLPFIVQATPTTINGQSVPAGLYASNVFFMNGTITNLMVGKLQLDDGHITNLSVAKLTAGSIAVGQYIQSTSYIAGSQGWRINGDGNAEFSGVVVRGTVYASTGQIGGNTIDATGMQSPGYVAGSTGWRLKSDGHAEFAAADIRGKITADQINGTSLAVVNGSFSGALNAATGSFAGALSAATGTFNGSLAASAINAVSSVNISGNAVTVIKGASAYGMTGVSTDLIVTASDIPFGYSTVPVMVTGTADTYNGPLYMDIGRNQPDYATAGNLLGAQPPSGVSSATIVDNVGVGTYTYSCYNHGGSSGSVASPTFIPYANNRTTTITVILGKR